MNRRTRRKVIVAAGASSAVIIGAVALAVAGAAPASQAEAAPVDGFTYRSSLQRDLIGVTDAKGGRAPYRVATLRRLEMWTAPDGATLYRQTCLDAHNPDSVSASDSEDPSRGQACASMEYRMSRAELDMGGILGTDATGLAARVSRAVADDPAPYRAALAVSVALNPAASTAQRKTALGLTVSAADAGGVTELPNGSRSVRVSRPNDLKVEVEFNEANGEISAYREFNAEGVPVSERTLERIASAPLEGRAPAAP